MWSETGAMLGYSGVGSDIALPASVKTMEMSDPYTCVIKIFLLMLLYETLTVTWMMIWNLGKNRLGGILSVFLLKPVWPFADSADNRKTFTYTRDRTIQKKCFMRLVVASESCHLLYA